MSYKRISPTPIIEGGTNATSMANTDGVVYYDGTRLVTTAVGTATNVLTSNGVGLAPTFQTVSAGALVLIQTQTASNSASLTFTTGITPTYNNYLLVYTNAFPINGGDDLALQISINGGATYINSGYASGLPVLVYNTGATGVFNNTAYMLLGASLRNFAIGLNGSVYLQNFTSGPALGWPALTGTCQFQTSGGTYFVGSPISTYETGPTVVNAFRIIATTGNIAQGTFSLYAVAQ